MAQWDMKRGRFGFGIHVVYDTSVVLEGLAVYSFEVDIGWVCSLEGA